VEEQGSEVQQDWEQAWACPVARVRALRFGLDGRLVPRAVALEAELAQGRLEAGARAFGEGEFDKLLTDSDSCDVGIAAHSDMCQMCCLLAVALRSSCVPGVLYCMCFAIHCIGKWHYGWTCNTAFTLPLCPCFSISDTLEGRAAREAAVQQVAERDLLRAEGQPERAGYTLREAVALSRSAVPSSERRWPATPDSCPQLRSLSACSVPSREEAVDEAAGPEGGALGLAQPGRPSAGRPAAHEASDGEGDKDRGLWRAVWVYAFSPEVQLVLALR